MRAVRLLRGWVLLGLPFAVALAQGTGLAIRGTVMDSTQSRPLSGAKVIVSGAPGRDSSDTRRELTATTDATGRFEITSVVPAVYLVTVEHPWLDSTGFAVTERTVDLREERLATLTLAVPSGKTIRSAFCPTVASDSTAGFVEGYVRDARSDKPVYGVRVVFAWSDFTVDAHTGRATPRNQAVPTRSARDGSFIVCGLPIGKTMLMQAQLDDRVVTGAIEVEIPPSGVLVRTLHIATQDAGTVGISGTLVRAGSDTPVEGAHVHLFGAARDVVSGADGAFRLGNVPIGSQSIEVTAPGLRPRRYAIDVPPDGATDVQIPVAGLAQMLDTAKTVAARSRAAALRDEFDQRVKVHAAGQYITEDMIARTQPWRTTDLIRYVAGFEFRYDTVFSTRGIYEIAGHGMCKPVLLIDGHPADTMNEVLPTAIHGIEIYPSSLGVPLKYPFSACGAIFVWTK